MSHHLLNEVGRVFAENEVLRRRCEEQAAEIVQLKRLLREQAKENDEESWQQWLAATTQAAARRAQR